MFAIETLPDESIQTPRLSLRAPRRSDLGELHRAVLETLPALVSWLPWAQRDHGLRDTRLYLRGARLARLRRRALEFLVEDSESHGLLGITSLHRLDWGRRCAGLGYWTRRSEWGRGVATEATRALVDFAFEELGLHRLELHVALGNVASLRVAEKLEFRREGVARGAELIDGRFLDHAQYALLRSDPRPQGSARA